ncbi:MAG: hypothetical protein DRG83_18835 [Deltaproteobacteria bacterium]|nr:MAG: hypothetical protein DRG83_18835 [Deltaproteobacteria bacterium]
MSTRQKRYFAISLIFFVLSGCASTKQFPIGSEVLVSGKEKPSWINRPTEKDTKKAKAFVGTSLNESMESQARAGALEDARKQIIDAMGVYGKRKINEVISSVGTVSDIINPGVVRDEATKMVSESIVKSRAHQYHIERWRRVTQSGVEYYYKAYVLVLFPNEQAAQITRDAIQTAAQNVKDEQDKRNIERALKVMEELKTNEW